MRWVAVSFAPAKIRVNSLFDFGLFRCLGGAEYVSFSRFPLELNDT